MRLRLSKELIVFNYKFYRVSVVPSPGPLVRRDGPGNHCICMHQSYPRLHHERECLSMRLRVE